MDNQKEDQLLDAVDENIKRLDAELRVTRAINTLMKRALTDAVIRLGPITASTHDVYIQDAPDVVTFVMDEDGVTLKMQMEVK